jgi:hypothetical protein
MQIADHAAGTPFRCPFCKQLLTVATKPTAATVCTAGVGRSSGLEDTADLPTECPACRSPAPPGAASCMECGYLLHAQTFAADEEEPILCVNPVCRAANPPNERNCVRCNTPLPYPAGTMIHGRYRIHKLLAIGGFGAVYRAADTQADDRPVAIKEITSSDLAEFRIRVLYLRREVEFLRLLQSFPIVTRVYDLIEEDHTAYVVLEFLSGKDLLLLLDRNNTPFPFEQVVEWGKAICDVLHHMHTRWPPLVHRGLAPENFLLLEDQRSIKMLSFDMVCAIGTTAEERGKHKTVVLYSGYAPIEQRAGMPEPRSDLFGLAATLYHLATAKEPEGERTAQVIEAQLTDPCGSIPADQRWFFELIKRNLADDVRERSSSAEEFKADLERRQVTRQVRCPKCQAANLARKLNCIRCSQPLDRMPCSACGENNRLGDRHCLYCGNKLG